MLHLVGDGRTFEPECVVRDSAMGRVVKLTWSLLPLTYLYSESLDSIFTVMKTSDRFWAHAMDGDNLEVDKIELVRVPLILFIVQGRAVARNSLLVSHLGR